MSDRATIMEWLSAETLDAYTDIEALPFFGALKSGKLPLASYVGLLHALSTIYDVFEREMSRAERQLSALVRDPALRKLPLIQRDLDYFESQPLPEAPVATLRAQLVAQDMRQRAAEEPSALLGYLFVLEGATLGGLIGREQLARALGLHGPDGLAYPASYEAASRTHWQEVARRMNRAQPDLHQQGQTIEAARALLGGLRRVVEALYPLDTPPPRDLVRVLNPEAGTHPLPTDPRELQAALRAGEQSWRQFPYYEWRYGQRGAQFTRSDSAWLVTLSDHPSVIVEQQVLWLGRVLAARGMPQWLLERHLELLHQELVAAVPEKAAAYERLQLAALRLREMRRQHIDDDLFQSLIAEFDQQVGDEWSTRLPATGGLLAAAVADERAGIVQAVTSIESWMTEPTRFPDVWIEAVRSTISKARGK